MTRWVTAVCGKGRRDSDETRRILATSLILVAASLVAPVATQGLVAAAYLRAYRLNGADCAGLAAHLTDVTLSSVEIGPRGVLRDGIACARA